MKRILIFILLFASCITLTYSQNIHIKVKGKVSCGKNSIANVAVTDGINIVKTNAKGEYSLQTTSAQKYVYYSLPSGYQWYSEMGVPQFYKKIDSQKSVQNIDFELIEDKVDRSRYSFVVLGDPQIFEYDELPSFQAIIDDLKEYVTSDFTHMFSLGDNIFEKFELFEPYKKIMSQIGLPFTAVIGNHDMDYNERSDDNSDETFSNTFGPSHHSFNIGNIHYVVLKDVFYTGYSYRYIGYISEKQLSWLEKDLENVEKGSTVVVAVHIPTKNEKGDENIVKNAPALYKILEGYNTHIIAGHTHTQYNNIISENIFEHTHSAACGAWWQGEIGLDGTPLGYNIYQVDGDSLSWYFKGAGKPINEQFRIYEQGDTILINVFNYDPKWKVEAFAAGQELKVERISAIDPMAYTLYGPGNKLKHSWTGVGENYHLFRTTRESGQAISIIVTDRFGRRFTNQVR